MALNDNKVGHFRQPFKNKQKQHSIECCFRILKRISDGVPLFLVEESFQHVADGLFQQGIRLSAHPHDISASARDKVGVDKFPLVIVDVKANLDAVGAE